MRAVVHIGKGGPEALALREVPTPDPGSGQIRVRVAAAGLNRADVLQRRGGYPAPAGWPSDIPGLEYAGHVEAIGDGVSRWQPGDAVMGLVGGGGHAEFVVVHADEAIPVPPGMGMADAAAIPESFLTGWDALVTRGRLQAGERVLLHAVGSGLGTATVQLAVRLGATVLGTSRTEAKLEQARALGLSVGIDTSKQAFRDAVTPPVDVIIDVLGGPAFTDNIAVLAPRGRLVMLGFLQGPLVEGSLEPVLRKRLEVIGSVMRSRAREERVALAHEFAERVLPWFAPGGSGPTLRPLVGARFSFTEIVRAHEAMEANEPFGKIVLTWD